MWIGGDGNWDDPSHWDIGAVPNNGGGNTYHAVINVPGDAQISINGSFTLDSIVNHEALWLRSGSMFNLAGSNSINEGLIQLQYSPGSTRLTLGGTFTNDGTIRTEQTHGYGHLIGEIYLNADTLIDGSGAIEMPAGSTPVINGAADTELTLGTDQTLHGQGNINVPVINHGTISADVGGRWLYLTSGVTNDGVLRSTGGGYLSLEGAAGSTTTRDIVAAGGIVRLLNTTLELNGKTLLADGGEVRLDNSTVAHGEVKVSDNASSVVTLYNAVTFTSAPWVDGGAGYFQTPGTTASLLGDRHIPADANLIISHSSSLDLSGATAFHNEGLIQLQYSPSSTRLTLGGTFTNDGAIRTEQTDWYYWLQGEIYLKADTVIDGAGSIEMAAGSSVVMNGAADTELTLGANQTLHGQGTINVPVINHGTISADVGGWWLKLNEGLTNLGELGAWNGGILHAKKGVTLGEAGYFNGDASGYVLLSGDLLSAGTLGGGPGTHADVRIEGSSDPLAPRLIEVVGRELGYTPEGFQENNLFAPLTLTTGYYQLVNNADDVAGDEAIYIDTLNVPTDATLDLNGQHIHVRNGLLDGTIIGDTTPPTSAVQTLPDYWLGTDLTVRWTGEDAAGGTGLACFDIYASTDEGPFQLWLDHTTAMSAVYPALDGHHYDFYSIARDNIGRTEDEPDTADTGSNIHVLAITSSPQTNAIEDTLFNYAAVSDSSGLADITLTWSLLNPPAGLGISPANGVVSGLFDNTYVGDHEVKVRVADNQGHHAEQTFTLSVANTAGVFTNQTATPAQLGNAYTFDLNSTDEGHGAVTYNIVSGPTWLTIDPASGVLGGKPGTHDLGAPSVTVSVDDGHGGTDTKTLTLAVQGQHLVLDPALKSSKATYTDANGDAVTAILTGKTGRVHLYRSIAPDGNGQYLNTTAGDLYAIELDGTGLTNSLTLTANKKLHLGDGFSTFGSLTGAGSLAKLSAAKLDIVGAGVSLPGNTIVSSTLHDVKNGADITLGGAQAIKGVSLTAHNLDAGANLAFGSPLKLLKSVEWTNGELTTPKATTIQVTRALDANLTLVGALSLLKAGTWSGALSAASLGKVSVLGDASADLELTNPLAKQTLGSASIGGSLIGAYWSVAGATGVITVAHDLDSATLDLQAKVAAITVKGRARDSLVRSAGDITKLTLGASEHSDFGAGIALNELQSSRHAGDASGPPTATIKSFTVSGLKVPKGQLIPRFFSDSFVSAKIGTMSVHNWDGLGGLWAPTGGIKKIIHHDTVQKDKEHNWVFPEPPKQVSGQPELFVHIL